ncbi:prephenate dehydratase [Caulobacter vibrioides]|uniref:prephenate dehydratase n=2 Tax=Caulobacter vibrioides TaxID=155892 RepID=Q9A4A4_CAUVC|nr:MULTISPECIES: prephenate dehydratase [Caulobacter]YP_002518401.1 prephenate dehydratase [Caulobacter vibrioides NA1000]AAK24895.1 prephenate dehydratase [Caulobacter vibrioides CB15]ACL96493.1 prephenate dehydratase [Caulobacter vibrioides NA1000]ATC25828.1 prephenate dehydratase [Caulobacter vibrioides]ATC29766.1 prephenate dehydratase [Caulobacter vibrioides]AZH13971.1 prephenate dehydratase [Caulobacter vibrioides]
MSLLKKIAFQGEPGANSHEACRTYFPDYEAYPCKTFEEAFEAIKSGVAQLGMIPIENSIAGRVADVHHLLPASGLKIIGERFKPIRFQLMANKGVKLEDIKVVSSMPIALSQCRNSLKRLGVETEAAGDTAGAAKALALKPNPTHAAVAPALAAEIYGLDILARDIEDERHNTTRFLVMTADKAPAAPDFTHRCVTSFVFRVRNLPAALYKALGGFATNGVNMTKLESYMEGGNFTATFFYAEVDGRPEDRNLALALDELKFFSERFEILGVYPADPFRDRGA